MGHPHAILDGAPWVTQEQVQAAKVFQKFLLAKEQQEGAAKMGLRPADPGAKIGPPIEPVYGADPRWPGAHL